MLKILDGLFMFLRGLHRFERPQVPAFVCFEIYLPGINPVLSRF
jgi:hypothetical protein